MADRNEMLAKAKERNWFYRFPLPDGTVTKTHLSDAVEKIHTARRDALVNIIKSRVPNARAETALDLASHEGYFSVELAKHFKTVQGLEYRQESIDGARLICDLLNVENVSFEQTDLRYRRFDPKDAADFVLLFGLMYHLEDPIHVLRLACKLARKHIFIETQVFPFDFKGRIEQGGYQWQRDVEGVFSLTVDSPQLASGGATTFCLTPSLGALTFLLKKFGFGEIDVLKHEKDDYEQFVRGHRVLIYAVRS